MTENSSPGLDKANYMYEKAIELRTTNKIFEAEKLFISCSKIFKSHNNLERYSRCLFKLGAIYIHTGNFPLAMQKFNTALKISYRINDKQLIADIIGNIGLIKFYKGLYNEASDLYHRELRINNNLKNDFGRQIALGKIANVYYRENQFDTAIKFFYKQSDLCIKINDKKYLTYAYGGLAISFQNKGDSEKAFFYYGKQISLCEEINELKSLSIAYSNIGIMHVMNRDYDLAENYYKRSVNIDQKLHNVRSLIYSTGLLGNLYLHKRDFKNSLKYFYKQLHYSEKLKALSVKGEILTSIGNIFKEKKDYKRSLAHFKKALKLCEKYNLGDLLYYLYENTGEVYKKIKKFDLSLLFFDRQLKLSKKIYGSFHTRTAEVLRNIGNVHLDLNNFSEALKYYQRSLNSVSKKYKSTSIFKNPSLENAVSEVELFETLKSKAFTLRKFYETESKHVKYLELSLITYEMALSVIDRMRLGFKEQNSKYFMSESLIPVYEMAIDTAFELYSITCDEIYIEKALNFSEKNKAAALLESIRESEAKIISDLPKELLNKEKFYKTDISYKENLKYKELQKGIKAGKKLINDLDEKIFKLKLEYNDFIGKIEKKFPEYYSLKYEIPKTLLKEIREKLIDDKSIFIEYFVGEKNLFTFSITDSAISIARNFKRKDFEKCLLKMREGIVNFSPLKFDDIYKKFSENAYKLYKILLKSAVEVDESKTNLIIVPDSNIGYIPFEALLTESPSASRDYKKLSYMINKFTISYGYSSLLLLKNRDQKKDKRNSTIIGFAPDFGKHQNNNGSSDQQNLFLSQLSPLNYNVTELKTISNFFPGEFFINKKATKKIFLKNAGNHSIIHLATHCIIDCKNPMYSKICFSTSGNEGDEVYLYNYELFNLKLNSRLVVLSACQTGFGKLLKGEGIMSVARGFISSNCHSILMSLWEVNDQSTSKLMKYFYKELKDGNNTGESLRTAKLKYLKQADRFHSAPFFWAPFLLIGKNDPVC